MDFCKAAPRLIEEDSLDCLANARSLSSVPFLPFVVMHVT